MSNNYARVAYAFLFLTAAAVPAFSQACVLSPTNPCPNLVAVKSNNVGGTVPLGSGWTWTIVVTNTGNAQAASNPGSPPNTTTFLKDQLPTTLTYGTVGITNNATVPDNMTCTIVGGLLECKHSTIVRLDPGQNFTFTIPVNPPSALGSYTNPTGGVCKSDPNGFYPQSSYSDDTCGPDTVVVTANPSFSVKYFSNLNVADSYVNITNDGSDGLGSSLGIPTSNDICVNVFTFDPAEELISCCACRVTPNALVSLSARNDLISNTLTPATPTSIVVKMVATKAQGTAACNAASIDVVNNGSGALHAWGTTIHSNTSVSPANNDTTETPFDITKLGTNEAGRIKLLCGFIQANGSGFGICKSCRAGGLGADRQ